MNIRLTKNRKIRNLPFLYGGVYFFHIFEPMNRILTKLLLVNFRQYAIKRRTPNKFIKKFSHESFVRLNPEE